MKVKVRYFASIRDMIGTDQEEVETPTGTTLIAFYEELKATHGGLNEWNKVLLAVNGEYMDPDQILGEGDVVAVFPPVSGG
jgi:molybdopterin synthase sulfur carrier subunit